MKVVCQFALYPMGISHYMDVIYREVEGARKSGVTTKSEHFCTRLEGELGEVFAALRRAFDGAERDAKHVVLVATLSKGSPTKKEGENN